MLTCSYNLLVHPFVLLFLVMLFGFPPFYVSPGGYRDKERIYALIQRGFDPSTKPGYGAHFPDDIPHCSYLSCFILSDGC